jgi:hypothetical protein
MKTIDDARKAAAEKLGLDLKGTKGSNLSQKDFFRLEDAMVDVVLDDTTSYPENVVTWANNKKGGDFYGKPPESTSLSEKVSIFTDEFVKQAEDINPLSQRNRGKSALMIWGVVLFAAFVYFYSLAKRTAPAAS